MNTDRLLKHAVEEKLAITVCINKVGHGIITCIMYVCTYVLWIHLFVRLIG